MDNIFWCKNCLNMSTRPRIKFDKNGICNACQWSNLKKTFNWKKREKIKTYYRNTNLKTVALTVLSP